MRSVYSFFTCVWNEERQLKQIAFSGILHVWSFMLSWCNNSRLCSWRWVTFCFEWSGKDPSEANFGLRIARKISRNCVLSIVTLPFLKKKSFDFTLKKSAKSQFVNFDIFISQEKLFDFTLKNSTKSQCFNYDLFISQEKSVDLNFSQPTYFGHLFLKTREKSMTFKPLWQVFHHVSLLFVTEAALLQRQALIAAGGLNSATTSKTTTCDMLFSLIIAYLFLRTI